jgi:hypothetical protein
MSDRFNYVAYDAFAKASQANFKELFDLVADTIEITIAPGRARSLALTHLEEAYMWVGKAIRDEQLDRSDV